MNDNKVSSLEFDKIKLIYIFTSIGSVVLLAIAFLNFLDGDKDMALFETMIAAGGILNAILLKLTRNVRIAESFILVGMLLLICGILVDGGYRNTGIYWIYTFPLLAFFLKGNKGGVLWNVAFFTIVVLLVVLDSAGYISIAYSTVEIRQALIAYTIVMLLAYIFEEALLRSYNEVSRLAVTDQLTGLYNRYYIFSKLEDEIERAKRVDKNLCVILFDIDNFKQINDKYGHDVGDMVLSEFSRILKNVTRNVDTVGRLGGEEFIVICPGTDIVGGKITAEKIRMAVESAYMPEIGKVTVSAGVAEFTGTENVAELIKNADVALYRAKKSGKNRVELYSPTGNIVRFGIDLQNLRLKKPASLGRH
ncbi:diguanylate cyclase (GGDEF) domain-containing protein [Persephonella hydrogeniphila]|uniref:diguanylate cyclase n=1 Tax=Persephonella hydrogeniphila TaxID=198703 RepID=A0A285NGT8_9AQUI|nr:GGDEF domain-containing protein [Persephonella hydrogeniphila]SNZ08659.1 diguanylate cyclase (GGDEF) domain-containing protein [Persephonella hydrogeniphila]